MPHMTSLPSSTRQLVLELECWISALEFCHVFPGSFRIGRGFPMDKELTNATTSRALRT
jgi:hypothetical protein